MMNVMAKVAGNLDAIVTNLDGIDGDGSTEFINTALSLARETLKLLEQGQASLSTEEATLSTSAKHFDLVEWLEAGHLSFVPPAIVDKFLENTGRNYKEVNTVRVNLASGKSLVLEGPFELVEGRFVKAETPLENEQCAIINLDSIEYFECTW